MVVMLKDVSGTEGFWSRAQEGEKREKIDDGGGVARIDLGTRKRLRRARRRGRILGREGPRYRKDMVLALTLVKYKSREREQEWKRQWEVVLY